MGNEKLSPMMEAGVTVLIPPSVENVKLPAPELITYYQNLEERTFWIDGEVNDDLLELVKLILQWNREDKKAGLKPQGRKPIKLYFFSPGGDLEVYRTLADVIRASTTPVIGVNFGIAYSAAAMIFLACHERYTLPSAYFLFHCGSSQMSGSYAEVSAAMDKYANDVAELTVLIQQSSTYTQEEVVANMGGDWYIDAQEALNHRLVSKIVKSVDEL